MTVTQVHTSTHDNRPEVTLRQHAKHPDEDGVLTVTTVAHCRFCTESLITPDVRLAIGWAEAHEKSLGHLLSKQEATARSNLSM